MNKSTQKSIVPPEKLESEISSWWKNRMTYREKLFAKTVSVHVLSSYSWISLQKSLSTDLFLPKWNFIWVFHLHENYKKNVKWKHSQSPYSIVDQLCCEQLKMEADSIPIKDRWQKKFDKVIHLRVH